MDLSDLSQEQKYAFSLYRKRKNVFISGPGGTGKTRLIEYIVKDCIVQRRYAQVCAMTGCATLLLPKLCNARTVHSWSGIRLCKGESDKIITNVLKYKKNKDAWKKIDILIIDEVSMMSKKIFEVLNEIGQRVRYNNQPFGGIQLVFLGDFYQLPPVGTHEDSDTEKFCFESSLWSNIFPKEHVILLKTIFRQEDPKYKEILLQVRNATLSKENETILQKYVDRKFDKDKFNGVVPTKLYPTRAKTDYVNNNMFQKLHHEKREFQYVRKKNCKTYLETNQPLSVKDLNKCRNLSQSIVDYETRYLLNSIRSPEILSMKVGALVMCTMNIDLDNGICNGSQGIISEISDSEFGPIPTVVFSNGKSRQMNIHWSQSEEYPSIAIGQIPLCLAWALTIHKIQGATLDMAEIDIGSQIFECGQTYVALSRIRSLQGLYLSAFNPNRIKINLRVKQYYDEIPQHDCIIQEDDFKDSELTEEEYDDKNIKKIVL